MTSFSTIWVAVAILVVGESLAKTTYSPMVAFVCDKGAMHMDPDLSWHTDPNTSCLDEKRSILEYCKQVYPSLDVTNIVEASESVTIRGWCPLGQKDCESPQTFLVQPYRCLTGPFQSDALVVPRSCVFDHVHDSDKCRGYDWWGSMAAKTCSDEHSMVRDSFAMLLPCDTDMFAGVEFVCCPKGSTAANTASRSDAVNIHKPKIEVRVSSSSGEAAAANSEVKDSAKLSGVVEKYLHLSSNEFENEHDVYELAKKSLLGENEVKIKKLMKEWSDARNRMLRLKEQDPKQAETLNKDITERFQKEYFAAQTEGDSKVIQLDAVHQQHVQTNFNYKKRTVMQELMDELQAQYYKVEAIMSSLQRYISVEEKDARHCMKHFLKIRSHDPSAAQDLLPATIEHLTLISTRINQSIGLLDTIPEQSVVTKIKASIQSWRDRNFVNLEKTIRQFKTLTSLPKSKIAKTEDKAVPHTDASTQSTKVKETSSSNMYQVYAKKFSQSDFAKKEKDIAPLEEEDEKEDEHSYGSRVDSLKKDQIDAEVQTAVGSDDSAAAVRMSPGATIAIACSLTGAIAVVVIAILMVKNRSDRSSASKYSQVSSAEAQDISPEDRHIAAMQHGYENPTYKLLEQRRA